MLAVKVELKAAEGELLVCPHEELHGLCEMRRGRGKRALGDYGQAVELGKDLGVELDMGVVSLKVSSKYLAAFDGFTVPAMFSEGLGHGLHLERRRGIHGERGERFRVEGFSTCQPRSSI